MSWENLIRDLLGDHFINSPNLSLDSVWILLEDNWSWPLLGIKELIIPCGKGWIIICKNHNKFLSFIFEIKIVNVKTNFCENIIFKMLLSSKPHRNKILPLNLSRLDLSFFSFFTSFFPRLLSSAIFSFIILIEFCVLFNALESLVPSTASSDNNISKINGHDKV